MSEVVVSASRTTTGAWDELSGAAGDEPSDEAGVVVLSSGAAYVVEVSDI